mmetsp:Transcript_28264/g.51095  ORF Transcript_28264/g.51095 Transcript_28264/m.51095 type:complete len:242 (-) Transcript_28264:7-732(-)
MAIPHRLAFNPRIGTQILVRCSSAPSRSSSTWANRTTLPGGFNADGLRDWAIRTDFGADGYENMTGQEIRRRRRQISDDPKKEPYADLFSKRVSDECSQYLARHPSPSDVLGRAFFGSRSFMGEKLVLSSLNSLFSLYPGHATTLPTNFKLNEQYLEWKVTMKAPLELICSFQIGGLKVKGCTMLAFDPSLRKAYHGTCMDVAEERIEGFLPEKGIQMHKKYAQFLLDGMTDELENIANEK